jgi:hypothetical protein
MRLNVDLLHEGKVFRAFEDDVPEDQLPVFARRYAVGKEAEPPAAVLRAKRKLERQKRVR